MDFIKNKLSYKVTKMQDFIPFLTVKQDTIPIEVRPYSEDVIPVFKKTLFLASQKLDTDQRTTNGRSIFCDVTSQIFPLMVLSGNSQLLKNGVKNKWHYSCCIVILGILGTPKERES